jgi:hypothetical protein
MTSLSNTARRLPRIGFLCGALAAASAGQALFFDWPGTLADGRIGESVCSPGDLDGDGFADVVYSRRFGGPSANQLVVRSGRDGAETAVTTVPVEARNLTAIGDADGDGVGDYAYNSAAAFGSSSTQSLVVRSGASGAVLWTISGGQQTPADVYFPYLAGGGLDYDGDGVGDLVTASLQAYAIPVFNRCRLYSGASGALLAQFIPPVNAYHFVFPVPDVTGDAIPDVVVTRPAAGYAVVLAGPSLTVHAVIPPPPGATLFGLRAGAAGDSDGDGVADLALAVHADPGVGAAFGDWTTRIYRGPTLAYAQYVPWDQPASGGRTLPTEDLDGDGHFDFVQFGPGSAGGSHGFRVVSAVSGGELSSFVSASPDGVMVRGGDLDFDGVRELVYAEYTSSVGASNGGLVQVWSASSFFAATFDLGGSCGIGSGGGGLFQATAPILGALTTFTLTGAAPSTGGNFVFDIGLPAATPFAAGCVFHLDLAHLDAWVYLPVATDAAGTATAALPLPSWPFASGFPVVGQAVLYPTSSAAGFDVSNGLLLLLGY